MVCNMKVMLAFHFVYIAVVFSAVLRSDEINYRPIVGVLTQEYNYDKPRPSFIAASYVKFVEAAGARVVPIMINRPQEEYVTLFNYINGILLPGGQLSLNESGYAKAAKVFYNLAIKANSKGDYFPVFGTCLGFEQLTYLTGGKWLLTLTNTTGAFPLHFSKDARESRFFKNFPEDVVHALATEPITANNHVWSLTVKSFNESEELRKFYNVLTTNTDGKVEFVSTIEGNIPSLRLTDQGNLLNLLSGIPLKAKDFPFYGTQWHAEKNTFEWSRPFFPHLPSAMKVTFFTADFFVNEARKNFHRFPNEEEESKALIYNYNPVYTKSYYEQIYLFF